jgi:hypothetical protein
VCGERGFGGVIPPSVFDVEIAYYVLNEQNDHVCLIRFDTTVIGSGPPGCVDSEQEPCAWTYEVELENPRVATDVNLACANSDAHYDAAWIMQMTGSRVALGFAAGGAMPVMKYRPGTPGAWEPYGNGGYSSNLLSYDVRRACRY